MLARSVGRGFRSEAVLQGQIARSIRSYLASPKPAFVRREMPIGAARPDFVVVESSRRPHHLALPPDFTLRHGRLLDALQQKVSWSFSDLSDCLFERPSEVERMLDSLSSRGLVVFEGADSCSASPLLQQHHWSVLAIEAKLSKWTRALEQALSYRDFADRVLVALDATQLPADSARILTEFRRAGVGLCLVWPNCQEFVFWGRVSRTRSLTRGYIWGSALASRSKAAWQAIR